MAANARPTLADNLREEIAAEIPGPDLGPYRRARRLLLHGEVVSPTIFCAENDCSVSVVSQAVAQLTALGWNVHAMDGEPVVRNGRTHATASYQVTNPKHFPTEKQIDAWRQRQQAAKARPKATNTSGQLALREPKATKPPTEGSRSVDRAAADREDGLLPPLPTLGQPLTVSALALNDDGTVSLVVRNGTQRWITTVEGAVATDA